MVAIHHDKRWAFHTRASTFSMYLLRPVLWRF